MTAFRLLGAATLLVLGACFGERDLEVRTISLDHLTAVQAMELAKPYLSKDGMVFHSKEMLNSISVKDHSRNVERIRNLLSSRDASPANVALHFQLIRATPAGEVGPGLDRLAEALGELLRFNGYELLSEAVVSASERGVVEQSLDGGGMPLQLGVRIDDLRGSDNNGSAELSVELRRAAGSGQVLATSVVVPMGQTVVLGSAYPGSDGNALILTVRGEMGSQRIRSASRRGSRRVEPQLDRADPGHAVDIHDPAHAVEIMVAPSVTQAKTRSTTTKTVVGATKTAVPAKSAPPRATTPPPMP